MTNLIRHNWYLFVILAVVIVAIPVAALRQDGGPSTELAEAIGPDQVSELALARQVTPLEPRSTPRDKALETIAAHQQRFDADPQGEDAPALLNAMGNLYRQRLSDYEQAANCFERMIASFPTAPNVRDAYLQLVICYERLGDTEGRTRTLRRILNDFPPESEMHPYAAEQLGR